MIEEKKKGKGGTIAIIILVIIILGLLCIIVPVIYDKYIKKEPVKKVVKNENIEKEIEMTDKLKNHVFYLPRNTVSWPSDNKCKRNIGIYTTKKMSIKDVNNANKIYSAILFIGVDINAINEKTPLVPFLDSPYISLQDVKKEVKRLYNDESVVSDYKISFSSKCYYGTGHYYINLNEMDSEDIDEEEAKKFLDNGIHEVYGGAGGGSSIGGYIDDKQKVYKITKDNNSMYLYTNEIPMIIDDSNYELGNKKITVYEDFDLDKEVLKIEKIYKNNGIDIKHYLNKSSNKKLTEDEYKKEIEKYSIKYKHTFKKNDENNYYYYSTEPVKE